MKTFNSYNKKIIFKNILNTLTYINLQHIIKYIYSIYFTNTKYLINYINQKNTKRQRRKKKNENQNRNSQIYQIRNQNLYYSKHRNNTNNKQKKKINTSL